MKRSCLLLILFLAALGVAYWYGWQRGRAGQPTPASVPEQTEPVAVNEAPPEEETASLPAGTGGGEVIHKVQAGETLHTIGLKYDLLWTTIAAANGLDMTNPVVKEGDLLRIPLTAGGEVIKEETLNVDAAEAATTQEHANNGQLTWRTDPIVVVRRTTPTEYHLQNEDTYTIADLNYETGQATVEVEHDNERLTVTLAQPAEKGSSGVWFITKIKRQSQ